MKKKIKIIHLAMDYPCIRCGLLETLCEKELEEDDEDNWTMDEAEVTCKKCLRFLKNLS